MIAHGISWTSFVILYGALAAGVIVLFLLRLTRRGRPVSSVLIWQKVMGATRSIWRELISLLIQLLVLLLVCLALVDPRPDVAPGQRQWIALIFDTSESMGAREGDASRLRHAERRIWEAIETLPASDRVMLVSAGNVVRAVTPFTGDREELKRSLADITAGGVRPEIDEAVSYALAAFDYSGLAPDDGKTLVILTDRPEQVHLPETPGVATHVVTVGEPAANLAITSFAVRRTMNLSASYDALVEATNYSDRVVHAELAVFTPEETLGVEHLSLEPGERYAKVVGLPFGTAGKLTALIRKTEFAGGAVDALPSDDAAFAFIPPVARSKVVLVSNGNPFLYNGLALNPEIDLTAVKPGDYSHALSVTNDVVIFDGVLPPQTPACNAVYFHPGPKGPFAIQKTVKDPAATSWADDHPMLRHVTMDSLTITSADIFTPKKDDVVLMGHFEGALMLLRPLPDDRFALGIGFELKYSDFPLQAAFPIFLHNVVSVLARRPEGDLPTGYQLGQKVELAVAPGRTTVVLKDPLDNKIVEPVRAGRAEHRPHTPGFYSYADGDALRVFAASLVDPLESDLRPSPNTPIPEFTKQTEAIGTEIYWPYLVLAAMLLIALDMVLFFYGRLG